MKRAMVMLAVAVGLGVLAGTARPEDAAPDQPGAPVRIRIFISSQNQIMVDGEIVEEAKLEDLLRDKVPAEKRVGVRVRIRAHVDADKGVMIKVAATARNVGYLDVQFEQAEKDRTPAQLIVVVPREGRIGVNDIPVGRDDLVDYVQKLIPDAERRKRVPVFIFSRRDVPYADLAAVAKLLRDAGFEDLEVRRIQN